MLAQIDPGIFNDALRGCGALFLRQTVVQSHLSQCKRCCANQPKQRNDAEEHLAAKIILVRPKLQAMCRLKYCRKNAVNNQSHNGRNDDDDDRRN